MEQITIGINNQPLVMIELAEFKVVRVGFISSHKGGELQASGVLLDNSVKVIEQIKIKCEDVVRINSSYSCSKSTYFNPEIVNAYRELANDETIGSQNKLRLRVAINNNINCVTFGSEEAEYVLNFIWDSRKTESELSLGNIYPNRSEQWTKQLLPKESVVEFLMST